MKNVFPAFLLKCSKSVQINRCISKNFLTCKFSYIVVKKIILVTYIANKDNLPSSQSVLINYKTKFHISSKIYTVSDTVYQKHFDLKIIFKDNCLYKPKKIFKNK